MKLILNQVINSFMTRKICITFDKVIKLFFMTSVANSAFFRPTSCFHRGTHTKRRAAEFFLRLNSADWTQVFKLEK